MMSRSYVPTAKARYLFPLISGPYFNSNATPYTELVAQWSMLTSEYMGWTLTEIKELTNRERKNWLEIASYTSRKG